MSRTATAALTPATSHAPLDVAGDAAERARRLIEDTTPENTRRARRGALRYFWAWATAALELDERYPVPPTVALRFLVDHLEGLPDHVEHQLLDAGVKQPGTHTVATLEARLSHLSKAHRIQGLPSPTDDPRLRETLAAARRARAQNGGQRQPEALTLPRLELLLATCADDTLIDRRDRALLLLAWASGGRRRSEVIAARVEDLARDGEDYALTIRRSKSDQQGRGHVVPVAGRAAIALDDWLSATDIDAGPIFRSVDRWGHLATNALAAATVARIVRKRAAAAGLDPRAFSAHSLRAGFMTAAGRAGISLQEAMTLSGHRSPTVAMRYHRAGDVLRSRAARLAG